MDPERHTDPDGHVEAERLTAAEALARQGGIATWSQLRPTVSRRRLRSAVRSGEVVRLRLGVFATVEPDELVRACRLVNGVASHLSAALSYEWKVLFAPQTPIVTVSRGRKLGEERRQGVEVRWATLGPDDTDGWRTSRLRTVIDCARTLTFAEALSVADSALREGMITHPQLLAEAHAAPRTGRVRAIEVATHADGRAANPFESALRALCLRIPGLAVTPQVWVDRIGRADLVDERLNLVIEAESWEFHGSEEGFARDIRRYTAMVRAGWAVVRFTWREVLFEPEWVLAVLTDLVVAQEGSATRQVS